MKTLKRENAIERLVDSRIDTCMVDPFYLRDILMNGGIAGFVNLNNKELEEEYDNEFCETVKIID